MGILGGIGDFIGTVGNAAATAFGAYEGYQGQKETNEMNRQIAQETNLNNRNMAREQMSFQERMSNTAFQRSRDDMLAAGLNPILMASKGLQASSPSGAAIPAVTGAPMGNKAQAAVNSALSVANALAQIRNINSQTELNVTKSQLAKADVPYSQAKFDVANWFIDKLRSSETVSALAHHRDPVSGFIKDAGNVVQSIYPGNKRLQIKTRYNPSKGISEVVK